MGQANDLWAIDRPLTTFLWGPNLIYVSLLQFAIGCNEPTMFFAP